MNVLTLPPVAVFLDVDGVINTKSYVRAESPKTLKDFQAAADFLDQKSVDNLHVMLRGLAKTRVVWVVISSSWRWNFNVEELKTIFKKYEFSKLIQGKTIDTLQFPEVERRGFCEPALHPRRNQRCRAAEINKYLREHPTIVEFVILDDLEDHLGTFGRRFVQIDPAYLITEGTVNFVLAELFKETVHPEIKDRIVASQIERSKKSLIYREGAPEVKEFYPFWLDKEKKEVVQQVAADVSELWFYFLTEEIKKNAEQPVLTEFQIGLFKKWYTLDIVDYMSNFNLSILKLNTSFFKSALKTIGLPYKKYDKNECPCDLSITVLRRAEGAEIKFTQKIDPTIQ